ncbi:MAG: transcription antitermination protein NusB [Candidatus Aegiribacteria sp.]
MGVRSRGRKALLQARFAAEMNGRSVFANLESVRGLIGDPELGLGAPLDTEDWEWISSVAEAVEENMEDIRRRIELSLENWSLERLSMVARLILEQGLGEMLYLEPPTPAPVVMDESIKLARMFETDEVAGLVNGVLDRIYRENEERS